FTLSNGVRVLVLEDHRFPTITTELVINGAGALYNPADQPGLASATVGLMRLGTATRSSRQLAEDIESLGATINGNSQAGSPEVSLLANGLSDNFDKWFPIA